MGLQLAFYVVRFLENWDKIVAALHLVGFDTLNSASLCVWVFQPMPRACPRKMVTHHPFLNSPSPECCGAQMVPSGIPWLCWVFVPHRYSIAVDPTIAVLWSVSRPSFDMAKIWCLQQMALNPWKRQMSASISLICTCLSRSAISLSSKGWQYTL